MRIKQLDEVLIRQLSPQEPIPYGLLLLADETREAIDKYIHLSKIYGVRKNFFIDNYPHPIYDRGIQLKHMIMLKKVVN